MKPDERAFEDHITRSLLESGGYLTVKAGNASKDFDPVHGLDTTELLAFIQDTQPEKWEQLVKRRGDSARAREGFLDRLDAQLDSRGTLEVLRHGVTDYGVEFSLAFFKPAHSLTPALAARYGANRLTVTRQLPYEKDSNKTLDLALFVNGIPVATAELKNPLTGQGVEEAKKQYREDRDPKNTTLRRSVVHFAVDPEEVAMTTRLAGPSTRFLPFNKGSGGGLLGGKGNPPNPADPNGHRTTYLWERVWEKDAWMDLLGRFVHAEKPTEDGSVRIKKPGKVIFPRYHQWDAVTKMVSHAREHGPGESYLVQHSAGSGKSNTIAWLAHRLSNLHNEANNKVFDKVVVITDRLVLDRQLQETIYQFEHQFGVVERITESSSQLAEALSGQTARIIITTLQKFPFVLDKIEDLPARSYAVLVDEAHSSQTGETAKDVKRVLGTGPGKSEAGTTDNGAEAEAAEDLDPAQQALLEEVAARGAQENLSFFAFTATPKGRTLEMFGTFDAASGHNVPFHLYSMRQSIEEGFSLDVLANYMTYKTFWKIEKTIEDDPAYDPAKAGAAIARFVTLHPHNLSQKAQVIVEHFRKHIAHKIGGRAKAMVVTSSRLHAVRMTRHLREYADEHGYDELGILVAFSDTVTDQGVPYTEAAMNAFPESQTPTEFEKDRWRFLVVAEKYQTGFDQPLLYAMYVDKVLTGLAAVQTLSRLNRPAEGKDGTFVLDFRNEAEAVQAEFEPYYGRTVAQPTDPNVLYDARAELEPYGVIRPEEVEKATALLVAGPSAGAHGQGHARIYAALAPAVDRFHGLEEERREAFRDDLGRFVRYYSFLSQVISFGDTAMERDYRYARALSSLIRRQGGATLDLGTEVELTHLQLEPAFEGSLSLTSEEGEVSAISDGHGPGTEKPEASPLSQIVDNLNERYGLNLTEADKLHFDGIAQDLIESDTVQRQAQANSLENFATQFPEHFTQAVAERLSGAEDLTIELLDNEDMAAEVRRVYLPLVYARAKVARQEHCPIGELLGPPPKEGAHLEYKSTFRTRAKDGPNGEPAGEVFKPLETASLKTIAAFLNSREGGTLLIGVADDGSVRGLESDYASLRSNKDADKDDRDLFGLHLNQAIINSVGMSAAANVSHEILQVAGEDLCRVHVRPSGFPVEARVTEVDKQGQHRKKVVFYGRFNNATRAVTDETDLERYKMQIWGAIKDVAQDSSARIPDHASPEPSVPIVTVGEAAVREATLEEHGREDGLSRPTVLAPAPSPPPRYEHPALVYLLSLSEGSRRTMRGALDTIAKEISGGEADAVTFPWHELRYEHATFIRAFLAHRYKPATANRMLSAMKGVLKECWRLGYMGAEDLARATDVKAVRGKSLPRGRRLPRNELRVLFELCAEDEKPVRGARDAALIAFLYVCGLRRAEIAALNVEDIDMVGGEVRVLSGKGNKERITYADSGALAAAQGWLGYRGEHDGPMFNPVLKNGRIETRRISSQTVYDILRRRGRDLEQQLGSKRFSPHDFRRTFISDLIAESKDLPSAQGLAGHASIETTSRYDRRGEIARRQAAARLQTPYQAPDRSPDHAPEKP